MTTGTKTFVHLTDLHLNAPGTVDPSLLTDTTVALRQSFEAIRRMDPQPDFMVLSGDLTNNGDVSAYEWLKNLLDELSPDYPVVMALGNHDRREGFYTIFPNEAAGPAAPLDHVLSVDGLDIVVLDSSLPQRVGGDWEVGQIDWLRHTLASLAGRPKLLVIHHPPMLDPNGPPNDWASLSASATEALRAALAGHPIVGILCGHIHLNRASQWHGIPVFTGAGHHAETDPLDLTTAMGMTDGTGFSIGTLRDSGLTMTSISHPRTGEVLRRLEFASFHDYLTRTGQDIWGEGQ